MLYLIQYRVRFGSERKETITYMYVVYKFIKNKINVIQSVFTIHVLLEGIPVSHNNTQSCIFNDWVSGV